MVAGDGTLGADEAKMTGVIAETAKAYREMRDNKLDHAQRPLRVLCPQWGS